MGGPQEPGVPVFSERKVLSGGQGDKEEQGAELSCESQKSTVVSKECGVCSLYDQSVIKNKKKRKKQLSLLYMTFISSRNWNLCECMPRNGLVN